MVALGLSVVKRTVFRYPAHGHLLGLTAVNGGKSEMTAAALMAQLMRAVVRNYLDNGGHSRLTRIRLAAGITEQMCARSS